MEQLSLTDAIERRDDAIVRANRHANDEWTSLVFKIIRYLAQELPSFTTDHVWKWLQEYPDVQTHEPRALGAMMREAYKSGWVEPTDRYENSHRPECHARPVRVWASRLYQSLEES